MVDKLRAAPDQRLTRADQGHVSLALPAPVLERVQELRVNSCQASEVLSVYLVGLALIGIDEPQLAGVGHQDLMSTLFEHPACPGRVGSSLDGYAHGLL